MPAGSPRDRQAVAERMARGSYYSAHSDAQRAGAAPGLPMLERAAADVPLPAPGEALTIADFGCAGGANEMIPMAIAIDALRKRRPDLPVEVVHADLPTNDFASLFTRLATSPDSYSFGRPDVFSYAAGRSLYGPVLPTRRVRLGWTAITVHWLSETPECQPDSVFSNLVTGAARAALARRARDDWRTFLTERTRELAHGGQLVVVGGASDRDGKSGAEGLFGLIDAQLRAMLDDGMLNKSEFDRIFYPAWNRTLDEFLEPFASGDIAAAFSVAEQCEDQADDSVSYPQFARDGDVRAFAEAYVAFVKAVTQPAFFRWIGGSRTISRPSKMV